MIEAHPPQTPTPKEKGPFRGLGVCSRRSWLRGGDLNPRPLGYEPNELPDCSTPRQRHIIVVSGAKRCQVELQKPTAGSRLAVLLLWYPARAQNGQVVGWQGAAQLRLKLFHHSFRIQPVLHQRGSEKENLAVGKGEPGLGKPGSFKGMCKWLPQEPFIPLLRPLRTEIRFHTGLWADRQLGSRGRCSPP